MSGNNHNQPAAPRPAYKVWVIVEKLDPAGGDPEELDLPFGATAEFAAETGAVDFARRLHDYGQGLPSN
jgi:hypothetical protein